MAAIASTDVTYTITNRNKVVTDKYKENVVTIAFGDGSLTYPSGGVPLTVAGLGLRQFIREVEPIDMASGNGLVYKYDLANNKIRIYYSDTQSTPGLMALIELGTGVAPAAATLIVSVKGV